MGIRVIHVLTHDSIGVGEDGPTHQPVEQMASLRAIPNLMMFRPADATETAECWQIALKTANRPSGLALTRQNMVAARTEYSEKNLCELGAYNLHGNADAKVTIFASGSEVEIAVAARTALEAKGITVRVVSVPSTELFFEQPDAYRKEILGNSPVKIAVEAAVREGWDAFIGPEGTFIGMKGFGASGPAKEVYKHFGITTEAVVAAAEAKLA
jgi:transketolase